MNLYQADLFPAILMIGIFAPILIPSIILLFRALREKNIRAAKKSYTAGGLGVMFFIGISAFVFLFRVFPDVMSPYQDPLLYATIWVCIFSPLLIPSIILLFLSLQEKDIRTAKQLYVAGAFGVLSFIGISGLGLLDKIFPKTNDIVMLILTIVMWGLLIFTSVMAMFSFNANRNRKLILHIKPDRVYRASGLLLPGLLILLRIDDITFPNTPEEFWASVGMVLIGGLILLQMILRIKLTEAGIYGLYFFVPWQNIETYRWEKTALGLELRVQAWQWWPLLGRIGLSVASEQQEAVEQVFRERLEKR